jgi:hypothetical protein
VEEENSIIDWSIEGEEMGFGSRGSNISPTKLKKKRTTQKKCIAKIINPPKSELSVMNDGGSS